MTAPDLPAVTEAHRLAAFEAMCWPGWTYEAALAYDLRRRLIECRAAQIRTREYLATHARSVVSVKRLKLGADGQPRWCTQMAPGPLVPDFFPSI